MRRFAVVMASSIIFLSVTDSLRFFCFVAAFVGDGVDADDVDVELGEAAVVAIFPR